MRNMIQFKDDVSEGKEQEEEKRDGLKSSQSFKIKEEKSLPENMELARPQQKTLYVKKSL